MNDLILHAQITKETPLVELFLQAQDISETSRLTYSKGLKQFFLFLHTNNISTPTRQDVVNFKTSLYSKLSPSTISTYITAIRLFFKWTSSNGFYLNIAENIKGARQPKGHRKDCLTVPQVKALLLNIDVTSLQGKRDYAFINLMVRTGLRTVEIVRADVGDIKQDSGEALLYVHGKGRDSKDEFVLLTHETLQPIYIYLSQRGNIKDTDPLFASMSDRNAGGRLTTRTIRGLVKSYLKGIGLTSGRLSAHSLRHTTVTLSLLSGASIQETQALARHGNITTTMRYAHSLNRLANAPERRIDEYLKAI